MKIHHILVALVVAIGLVLSAYGIVIDDANAQSSPSKANKGVISAETVTLELPREGDTEYSILQRTVGDESFIEIRHPKVTIRAQRVTFAMSKRQGILCFIGTGAITFSRDGGSLVTADKIDVYKSVPTPEEAGRSEE